MKSNSNANAVVTSLRIHKSRSDNLDRNNYSASF